MTEVDRAREVLEDDRDLVDEVGALLSVKDHAGASCAVAAYRIQTAAQARSEALEEAARVIDADARGTLHGTRVFLYDYASKLAAVIRALKDQANG